MIKKLFIGLALCFLQVGDLNAQLYFPANGSNQWDTLHPMRYGWCDDKINNLYSYLDSTKTDAFLLLKDGKIVLEKYFGTFTRDSLHTWNSAGKTLMAALIGKAQEENLLDLTDSTSQYLGAGWTSLPPSQEGDITIWNQLTMTTGLDDSGDLDCTDPACLTYMANPGTRWSYHNAPYTLLHNVLASAAGTTVNLYLNSKIHSKIGTSGNYYSFGYNKVFVSNPRSMARFGLLLLANGTWNGTPVITDQTYLNQLSSTSQNLNLSYGYLTWLNGKSSFMIPQSQFVFNGSAMPDSPADMFAALGKNSQILNVVPSRNMILVRMGDDDGVAPVSTIYNNEIWKRIEKLNCESSLTENQKMNGLVYPNPGSGVFQLSEEMKQAEIKVFDQQGKEIVFIREGSKVELSSPGIYFLHVQVDNRNMVHKIIVQP